MKKGFRHLIASRIKQLRISAGYSLEMLVDKIGRRVTKQALSKYERGLMMPAPTVLAALGSAFGVKPAFIISESAVKVAFLGFRRRSRMSVKSRNCLQESMKLDIERRAKLCLATRQCNAPGLPVKRYAVKRISDAEKAADRLRIQWHLGNAPISNLVKTLESNNVHVLVVSGPDEIDGISALASCRGSGMRLAAVLTRTGISGERQRLNLAHELGHLALKVAGDADEEKASFRFAAAFLAPADSVRQAVGPKRARISYDELADLKKRFGISMQAILYRLKDLEIIGPGEYRSWCIRVNREGWRKEEPGRMLPEVPSWVETTVSRALAEGVISRSDAHELTGERIDEGKGDSGNSSRSVMRMPLADRRKLMAAAAGGSL
jgi:Zn-dependent peptidase ImmA (M78 family)/transcriptional regulator with XRE-family HTH domain